MTVWVWVWILKKVVQKASALLAIRRSIARRTSIAWQTPEYQSPGVSNGGTICTGVEFNGNCVYQQCNKGKERQNPEHVL